MGAHVQKSQYKAHGSLSSLALMHVHYGTDVSLGEVADWFAQAHSRRVELGRLLKGYYQHPLIRLFFLSTGIFRFDLGCLISTVADFKMHENTVSDNLNFQISPGDMPPATLSISRFKRSSIRTFGVNTHLNTQRPAKGLYTHLDDHNYNLPTYDMTPRFKPYTALSKTLRKFYIDHHSNQRQTPYRRQTTTSFCTLILF